MDAVPLIDGDRRKAPRGVRLFLRLVGDFEAQTAEGRSVLPISKKARALLALVAAHTSQPVRRDFAAALLWSGKPRDQAANSLRQALRELQIALAACGEPPLLLTGGGRLTLQSDSVWIDIHDPAAIRWKEAGDGGVGPLLLCQNLQGLDQAFDAHLERVWKNLVFHQAFVPQPEDVENPYPFGRAPDLVQTSSDAAAMDGRGLLAPKRSPQPPIKTEDGAGQGWRIAVLPFRSLGATLEGGLSLGLAEEISAALARFRMPRLIATSSFWDGSGPSPDALTKARAFGLDYVISGTIQSSGQRIRVTVTLLDVAMDFEVIWASRFEGFTSDLFQLQDKIASQTVARIDPELLQRHQSSGDRSQTPNAVAYHTVLTAIQSIYRPDKDRFLAAEPLLLKAIELDSSYAGAHAWLAYWYVIGIGHGWIDDPAEAIQRAGTAAERAIALDPLDARGLTIAGHVKAYLLHDLDSALDLHRRATTLNPNLPIAWACSSWSHIYRGEHQIALDHAMIAESLSPADPHVFFVEHAQVTARLFLRDLETAERLAAAVLERRPRHAVALKARLATLGHLGRSIEAAECLKMLRALEGEVKVGRVVARPPLRETDREYYAEGLRLGGMTD